MMARSILAGMALLMSLTACSSDVLIASSRPGPIVTVGGSSGSGGAPELGGNGVGGTAPVAGAGEAGDPGEPVVPRRVLADSVADFSFLQGAYGWYYGFDNGSLESFKEMTRQSVITTYVPVSKDVWNCWASQNTHWAQLFELGGHPNGTDTSPPSMSILERVVRRWVSDYAGDVVIRGEVAKIDVADNMISNGVDVSIYVDGGLLYTQLLAPDDDGGWSYEVPATVGLDSTVDFVIDPHEGDDHNDLTRFTGVISRALPAPTR